MLGVVRLHSFLGGCIALLRVLDRLLAHGVHVFRLFLEFVPQLLRLLSVFQLHGAYFLLSAFQIRVPRIHVLRVGCFLLECFLT